MIKPAVIAIVSLTLLGFGCSKKKDSPQNKKDTTTKQDPVPNTPEAGLSLYEDIRAKLAADDLTGLAALADRLGKTAGVLKTAAAKEARAHWGAMAKATRRFAGVKDLEAARKAFGHLSRPAAALVAQGKPYAKALGVFQCPMVEDGFPYWVQEKGEVSNPYMGKKMLVCGGEVDPKEALAYTSKPPAVDSGPLLAAEMKAFEAAKPIFDEYCNFCHTTPTGKISKKTKKALKHFVMDKYPFGGHHAGELGETIPKVLGTRGKKATMPQDDKGAVQGKELELILAWAKAFTAAHEAKAGYHKTHYQDHKDGHGDHKGMDMKKGDHKGMDTKKSGGHSDH